jgi:hypothetical protein
MEIDHHLGDSLFRRFDAPMIGAETKLPADRGLHAGAVENLPLDFRGRQCLDAHGLDGELIPILGVEVPNRADEHAATDEELLLGFDETGVVPREIWPVGPLPVPLHDR